MAEQKYLKRKNKSKQTQKRWPDSEITFKELQSLDTSYESMSTGISFLFVILTMILGLFSLIGVLLISLIVYLADEEIQMLFEIPEVDSRIFRLELRESTVLIPFFI
jgi:hypothetical protein